MMNEFIYKKNSGITALSARISDFSYKKHAHSEYAIGITKGGIQHYHLDGSLQLSHQNGIMLFNPEQIHDGMAHDQSGLEYIMLYIEPHLLLDVAEKDDIVQFEQPVIYNKKVQTHIERLAQAIFHQEEEVVMDDLLVKLTDNLLGYSTDTTMHKTDTLIDKMKRRIHDYLNSNLKIELIAKEFGMSKFQFIRFFKNHTGITPYQYYLNLKIESAKYLIEKERDIYSAVSEFGFVDLTHLNRQFKKIYGLTANDYANYMN